MNDKWAEISIHTTQEATEAVAAVFHELGAGGVVIEDPDLIQSYRRSGNWTDCIFPDEPAVDYVTVMAYLPSDEELPGKLRVLSTRIDELAGHSLDKGKGTIHWREVREAEWADSWKQYFHTSRIGERFVVKPSWEEYSPENGDIILDLDPGMAFGTGTHGTTILCLESIESLVKPGMTVFDIGAGSGILSIASAKLGAATVKAVEYDAMAMETARHNVKTNGVEAIVEVSQGNLMDGVHGQADIIVGNLIADLILKMAPAIPAHLKQEGCFVGSGIIKERLPDVTAALAAQGLFVSKVTESGEWAAVVACRSRD
ncbi:MAG TPA: 50S ribosomal protein L11 methyltransferase [Negativicutes bacterium]|nr:50S ribosomal protein L11 methyltransferase [Negativicutes bacterium]